MTTTSNHRQSSSMPRMAMALLLVLMTCSMTTTAATSSGDLSKAKKIRHFSDEQPQEIDVEAKDTYDSSASRFMHSPCRPEKDGFFGSTSGTPTQVEFGFLMEAKPLADIDGLMDVVHEYLMDEVLIHVFPSVCGFSKRRNERRLSISGFWFGGVSQIDEACAPGRDEMNFCGVFKGTMKIFGVDANPIETLTLLNESLNGEASKQSGDIIQIATVNSMFDIDDAAEEKRGIRAPMDVTVIGMMVGGVFVLLLSCVYFAIRRKRVTRSTKLQHQMSDTSSNTGGYRDSGDSLSDDSSPSQFEGSSRYEVASGDSSSRRRENFGEKPSQHGHDEEPDGVHKVDDDLFMQKQSEGLI